MGRKGLPEKMAPKEVPRGNHVDILGGAFQADRGASTNALRWQEGQGGGSSEGAGEW